MRIKVTFDYEINPDPKDYITQGIILEDEKSDILAYLRHLWPNETTAKQSIHVEQVCDN